jgi:hypothetical protein
MIIYKRCVVCGEIRVVAEIEPYSVKGSPICFDCWFKKEKEDKK